MLSNDAPHTNLAISADITDEPTLFFETEEAFQAFGELMGYSVIVCDASMQITYVNSLASEILDLPKDYLSVGKKIRPAVELMFKRGDFGPDTSLEQLNHNLQRIETFASQTISSKKAWKITQPNGKVIEITHLSPSKDFTILLAKERTQNQKRDDILKMAMTLSHCGYFTYSYLDHKSKLSDSLSTLMTDAERQNMETNGIWPITHPDDLESLKKSYADGLKNGEIFEFTHRVVLEKHGTLYFRNICKPEVSTSGKPIGIICLLMDVTDMQMQAKDLKEAKQAAQDSLLANNKFLAGVSHEIRTPMNGIIGMADALLHSGKHDNISMQLNVILDSAHNMLRLLDETLEHSRLSAGKIEIVTQQNSPRKMLNNLHVLWHEKAQENGNQLHLVIDKNVPDSFLFDRFRFEQCLNNLLSNAIKFTQNGNIHIIAKLIDKADGNRPIIAIAVRDTGIGMTEDQQSHVFNPYEQADETISGRFGGTGLGMSICKNFMELMGGNIKLKSKINEGTTFVLTLPCKEIKDAAQCDMPPVQSPVKPTFEGLSASQAQHVPPTNLDTPSTPSRPLRASDISSFTAHLDGPNEDEAFEKYGHLSILVVEDNEINQVVVKALLETIVGSMYFANNGAEALEILKSTPIDVVLMDIHMPVMDGIETTLAIRTQESAYQDICIIALTADPEYQQQRICKNIGMNDAIAKPVSRKEVLKSFETTIDHNIIMKRAS